MSKEAKDAPAFDFYPERFWFAVEGWTEAEIVRYWRLLGQQWMRDGLPVAEDELAGLARGKVTPRLLSKFPVAEDGLRRNRFLEQLRVEQRERIAKRRAGAGKTNAKRWGKKSLSDSLSDSVSDRSATIERLDSESPPPTTHHPPHFDTSTPGGSDLCTEEEAWKFAQSIMLPITREGIALWHGKMQGKGWRRSLSNGGEELIGNWKGYLKGSTAWIREEVAKAQAAEVRAKSSGRPGDISARRSERAGPEQIIPRSL